MQKFRFISLPAVLSVTLLLGSCGNGSGDKEKVESGEVSDPDRPRHIPRGFEKVHPDGLYLKHTAHGEGETLDTGDVAIFHFTGKRADNGKTFENTYESGTPRKREIGQRQMCDALNIILAGARVGDEFKMYVPPSLGYGDRIVKRVPAGTELIMEVPVLGKKSPKPAFDTTGIQPVKGVLDMAVYYIEKTRGKKPVNGDFVKIHYNGYFADTGEKFDSSYDRDHPIGFTVGSGTVIQGMDAAARSLREGEKARIIVPVEYGYGAKGRNMIPGNKSLVFDMWLVEVGKPQ